MSAEENRDSIGQIIKERIKEKIKEKKGSLILAALAFLGGAYVGSQLDYQPNNISRQELEMSLVNQRSEDNTNNLNITPTPNTRDTKNTDSNIPSERDNRSDRVRESSRCVVIGKDASSLFDAWRKLDYPKGKRGEVVVIYKREGYPEIGIADNDGDRNNQPDIIPEVKRKLGGPKKGDIMCRK